MKITYRFISLFLFIVIFSVSAEAQGFKTILDKITVLEERLNRLEASGTGASGTSADAGLIEQIQASIDSLRAIVAKLAERTEELAAGSDLLEGKMAGFETRLSLIDPAGSEKPIGEFTLELRELLGELRSVVESAEVKTPVAEKVLANVTVSDNFKMRLYGFVKVEAFYDDTELAKGDWLLFVYPGDDARAEQDVFSMNARHTRLGMNIDGPSFGEGGKITGKIEMDFAGGFPNSSTAARQPLLRLRHAWVQVSKPTWEARFGQDWALIAGPFPNTTSFVVGAGKGNLWMRYPQIRYTVKKNPVRFSVSINRPMAGNIKYDDYAGGDFDFVGDGERSGTPWIMGRLWYTEGKATVSVSGHYGQEQINDNLGVKHDNETFSLNADLQYSSGPLKLTARAFYGENLNSFFGGVFQGFARGDSTVTNISSKGGWAQMVYSFNKNWSATVGGGMDDPEDDELSSGNRCKNDWLFTNITYNLAKSVTFMLEYEHLKTSYIDREAGKNKRIQFVTYYKF